MTRADTSPKRDVSGEDSDGDHAAAVAEIRASELFDPDWYLARYPDVGAAGVDPLEHWVAWGSAEGRLPGPKFDVWWYLSECPKAGEANINPILHYLREGRRAGLAPTPAASRQEDAPSSGGGRYATKRVVLEPADYSVRSVVELARHRSILLPGARYILPNAARYENVGEHNPGLEAILNENVYLDRTACVEAVELVELGAATVHTGNDFVVTVEDSAVAEQVPPLMPVDAGRVRVGGGGSQGEVAEETLIVARYGLGTWGHWLGELLPKIAIVEAFFPGRFRYAVFDTYSIPAAQTYRDSIAAYGIGKERLVLLKDGTQCHLGRAWALTSVWSDFTLHPGAAELMRTMLPQSPVRGAERVALLRPPSHGRYIANWDAVADLLQQRGFAFEDTSALPFLEQVALFRSAGTVFGVLGSGLTGLIYGPAGVAVASAAPPNFADRFFYALISERRGAYTDVRGPIRDVDELNPQFSSFTIDPAQLAAGLDALG